MYSYPPRLLRNLNPVACAMYEFLVERRGIWMWLAIRRYLFDGVKTPPPSLCDPSKVPSCVLGPHNSAPELLG